MMAPSEAMQEAERLRNLVRSELARRESVANWADARPPDTPIELLPEFSYLSEFPDGQHELLQREPVDSSWSPQMEARLQGFFASRPEITATFGFPTINCRTSACEIAFVAYGVDDTRRDGGFDEPLAAGEFRRQAVMELDEQPWADRLSVQSTSYRFQAGAATFLWYLRRVQD